MELNEFAKSLEAALIKRGISEDKANRQVTTLRNSFTKDDLEEIKNIQTEEEIDRLADNITAIIKKTSAQNSVYLDQSKTESKTDSPEETFDQSGDDYSDIELVDETQEATTKGMTIFWVCFVLLFPVILCILAIPVAFFAALFLVQYLLIILGLALMVAVIAAGALIALIGIIYGITQLFSFTAAGIFEIGLGVAVIGCVLAFSVLIYNFSVRLIPWLIRKTSRFAKFVFSKIKALFLFIRKECYRI